MALADRVDSGAARKRTGLPCSIAELEAKLQGKEADAFRRMMYELGWSQERIYAEVTAEGHYIGKQTINRHRSGACCCFMKAAA